MERVEVEAFSIEEAIAKASEILHVDKEQIDIQLLAEGKMGLFGKPGAKKIKVRATLKKKKS